MTSGFRDFTVIYNWSMATLKKTHWRMMVIKRIQNGSELMGLMATSRTTRYLNQLRKLALQNRHNFTKNKPKIAKFEPGFWQKKYFWTKIILDTKFWGKSRVNKNPKNRQVWLRKCHFWGFQQVFQNRHFLGGESPPKVWRHWASEKATLAQNRHNWKPCIFPTLRISIFD